MSHAHRDAVSDAHRDAVSHARRESVSHARGKRTRSTVTAGVPIGRSASDKRTARCHERRHDDRRYASAKPPSRLKRSHISR